MLLQRVLDSLLQRHMGAMPGQVQLQLLDLLHRTVKAAAATNADAWRCAAAAQTLAAAAGGKQLPGAWELEADGSLAAGAAAGGLDGPDGVDVPPAAATGDAAQWEQLHPALVRQEAEGGCLYIGALQRFRVTSAVPSTGSFVLEDEGAAARRAAQAKRQAAWAAAKREAAEAAGEVWEERGLKERGEPRQQRQQQGQQRQQQGQQQRGGGSSSSGGGGGAKQQQQQQRGGRQRSQQQRGGAASGREEGWYQPPSSRR